ncbi:MAG: Branched-chain-amino-acid aminotransferase [Dehalococcoidia bacterium]|nr:Branched-chain-amino-acid aminotransferase [Bacillota bacterium]MBT9142362.1 Branched-chain-amino-acid aminotransferase [Bacillota bacterium]
MNDYYYLNGTLMLSGSCQISVTDRSYLFGDGLFETILVQNSKPLYLSQHLNRLQHSSVFFAYNLPSGEELVEAMQLVIEANALENGSIRLTVSPRESQRLLAKTNSTLNLLITLRHGRPYSEELYEQGFTAIIAQTTRRNEHSPLSRHKTTNFADSIIAKQEALQSGSNEAILLNTAGRLTEATVANLFLIINGEVLTPPIADGILPGVIRQKVLELCQDLNITAREQTMTPKDLEQAEEVFITNSLMGVMPIREIQSMNFSAKVTRQIAAALRMESK